MKLLVAIALVGLVALAYCAEIATAIEQETEQLNVDADEELSLREKRSFPHVGNFGSRFNNFNKFGRSQFGSNKGFGRNFGNRRFGFNNKFGGKFGNRGFFGRNRFHL